MSYYSYTSCSISFERKDKYKGQKLEKKELNKSFKNSTNRYIKNAMEVMKDFIKKHKDYNHVSNNEIFKINQNTKSTSVTENFKYIFFSIEYGIYGKSSKIIDVKSKKERFTRLVNDVELMNLNVVFAIPKSDKHYPVTKSIIIFENIDSLCVKNLFFKYFNEYMEENYNLSVLMSTICSKEQYNKFNNNKNFLKINYIINDLSNDIADKSKFGFQNGKELRKTSVYILKKNISKFIIRDENSKYYEFENIICNCSFDLMNEENNFTSVIKDLFFSELPNTLIDSNDVINVRKLNDYFIEKLKELFKNIIVGGKYARYFE